MKPITELIELNKPKTIKFMTKYDSLKSLEEENAIITDENKGLLPNGYAEWQKGIEQLIEVSKLRTAISVNADTLTLYWNIGNYTYGCTEF